MSSSAGTSVGRKGAITSSASRDPLSPITSSVVQWISGSGRLGRFGFKNILDGRVSVIRGIETYMVYS